MTELDDRLDTLLRTFRAPAPEPPATLEQRIAARTHAVPPSRRRRHRSWRLRLVAIPVAVAMAITLAVALEPGADPAPAPSLLTRAQAAVTMPHRILAIEATVTSTTYNARAELDADDVEYDGNGVITAMEPDNDDVGDLVETYSLKEWTLAGAGQAMATRIMVTDPSLHTTTPSDEDTTLLTDRQGRVIDQRSWSADQLHIGGIVSPDLDGSLSLIERLREAYRHNTLKPAGHKPDGALRLRGAFWGSCKPGTVTLDPHTFIPRRVEINVTAADADLLGAPSPTCDNAKVTTKIVMNVTAARYLPATADNRHLLSIGNWPTRQVLDADGDKLGRLPPVPPLDEN